MKCREIRRFALPLFEIARVLVRLYQPDGVMADWGIAQSGDPSVVIYPLRKLYDLSLGWLASLQKNDDDARECRIRLTLADANVLKPKLFLFRR